ncbi:sigma-54 interaction domain-containing protein [Acerihabitans arboris]|nr:sigma 54-interacting transcriptional regulator [Acerihabitans arboris]
MSQEHLLDKDSIDFKKIVDNLECPVYITNSTGVTKYVNKAYIRENPLINPADIIGRSVEDIIQEGKYFNKSITREVINSKKEAIGFFAHHLLPDKMAFVSGRPVLDDENEIEHVVSILYAQSFFRRLEAHFNYPIYSFDSYRSLLLKNHAPCLDPFANMIGTSKCIEALKWILLKAAKTDATILIQGESGTGKEVAATNIQNISLRAGKPFIKINCAAIPANLIESELFGYEKGAFTGAAVGRAGFFEQANGGTIFLDEIGDLPFDAQAKLLRVLQQKEIQRLGGNKLIKLDIRVIAATNSNLREKIVNKEFREDLYYRLNLIPVYLAPLRERKIDIPLLVEFFCHRFDAIYNRIIRFEGPALNALQYYDWPGNIRELENFLEYLYICSDENIVPDDVINTLLTQKYLPPEENLKETLVENFCHGEIENNKYLKDSMLQIERKLLQLALDKYKTTYNMAVAMGVSQPTVVRKMHSLGIGHKSHTPA